MKPRNHHKKFTNIKHNPRNKRQGVENKLTNTPSLMSTSSVENAEPKYKLFNEQNQPVNLTRHNGTDGVQYVTVSHNNITLSGTINKSSPVFAGKTKLAASLTIDKQCFIFLDQGNILWAAKVYDKTIEFIDYIEIPVSEGSIAFSVCNNDGADSRNGHDRALCIINVHPSSTEEGCCNIYQTLFNGTNFFAHSTTDLHAEPHQALLLSYEGLNPSSHHSPNAIFYLEPAKETDIGTDKTLGYELLSKKEQANHNFLLAGHIMGNQQKDDSSHVAMEAFSIKKNGDIVSHTPPCEKLQDEVFSRFMLEAPCEKINSVRAARAESGKYSMSIHCLGSNGEIIHRRTVNSTSSEGMPSGSFKIYGGQKYGYCIHSTQHHSSQDQSTTKAYTPEKHPTLADRIKPDIACRSKDKTTNPLHPMNSNNQATTNHKGIAAPNAKLNHNLHNNNNGLHTSNNQGISAMQFIPLILVSGSFLLFTVFAFCYFYKKQSNTKPIQEEEQPFSTDTELAIPPARKQKKHTPMNHNPLPSFWQKLSRLCPNNSKKESLGQYTLLNSQDPSTSNSADDQSFQANKGSSHNSSSQTPLSSVQAISANNNSRKALLFARDDSDEEREERGL